MTEEGGGLHQHTAQSAPGVRWSTVSRDGEPASPPGREALTVGMDMSGLLKRSSSKEAAEATPLLNQEGPGIQLLSACLVGCIFRRSRVSRPALRQDTGKSEPVQELEPRGWIWNAGAAPYSLCNFWANYLAPCFLQW